MDALILFIMKSFIIKVGIYVGIVAILIAIIVGMSFHIKLLKNDVDHAYGNAKAWMAEADSLQKTSLMFKMTIDEFELSNDSLSNKLKKLLIDNNIKARKIHSLQYQLENISKTETIYVRDTIFKTPDFILDTCITDKWSKTCLHLQYPNQVSVTNYFNNEKYIICKYKRVPIKPKKCKIAEWFARKHKVVEITVIDKNPYVTTPKQRFVEIINNKSK